MTPLSSATTDLVDVTPIADAGRPTVAVARSPRAKHRLVALIIRGFLMSYSGAMAIAGAIGRRRRPAPDGRLDVLVTGTFHSDNWVRSHLLPLAASARCKRVRVVSAVPIPAIPKVEAIYPPAWLRGAIGAVPSRLVIFTITALRSRPDIVGGFHLLFNGLLAALVARLSGARSLYFCVGGPAEVLGGGVSSENRLFGGLSVPEEDIERRLVGAVGSFDYVITMGDKAVTFFQARGVTSRFFVVSGGIDARRFAPVHGEKDFDLILVARLAPIKQIDLFLRAVAQVKAVRPDVRAAIVGDGALMGSLVALAAELGIAGQVTFAGQQTDVQGWLQRSRIFVLTSQSEGLALSMMEAMVSGLPAVVSRVGDLDELVEDGVNGWLVWPLTPDAFAARILDVLADPLRLDRFSRAAREAGLRYDVAATTRTWDEVLSPAALADTGRPR